MCQLWDSDATQAQDECRFDMPVFTFMFFSLCLVWQSWPVMAMVRTDNCKPHSDCPLLLHCDLLSPLSCEVKGVMRAHRSQDGTVAGLEQLQYQSKRGAHA